MYCVCVCKSLTQQWALTPLDKKPPQQLKDEERGEEERDFLLLGSLRRVTHRHVLSSERVREGRGSSPPVAPPASFQEPVVSFTAMEEPSG